MKKVISKIPFTFRFDGNTTVEISPAGTICTDAVANELTKRYGGNVSVSDIDVIEEAKALIEATVTEEVETTEETTEEVTEEVEHTDLTDLPEAPADKPKSNKKK